MSISQEHLYEYKIAKYNTKLQAMRGGVVTLKSGKYAFVVNREEAEKQVKAYTSKRSKYNPLTLTFRSDQINNLITHLKKNYDGSPIDTVSIDILNTAWSKIGYRIDLSPSAIRKEIKQKANIPGYAAELIETTTETLARLATRLASCGIQYPATLRLPDLIDISNNENESGAKILQNVNTALEKELEVTNRFVRNDKYALDTVLIIDVSIIGSNNLLSVYTTKPKLEPAKPA